MATYNALEFEVDVLVLKYAQANYGLDSAVSKTLIEDGVTNNEIQPKPGGFRIINNPSTLAAQNVMFIGVVNLYNFGYKEIRNFSRRVLSSLAGNYDEVKSIAVTLHGAGYGLDEIEAFESEVAGFIDSIKSNDYPSSLKSIYIIESNSGRASRLERVLEELIPKGVVKVDGQKSSNNSDRVERLRSAGYESQSKQHVFVAMPFKDEMDDIYHYGIQGAVRKAGYLCERADLSSFTGDVMGWVRERIKSASLVVADLTDANPNVYLEVGFAWGCDVPTVLLVKDTEHLKFDVQSQRCIAYKKITELEESLSKELSNLKKEI